MRCYGAVRRTSSRELRIELYDKVNALGIGAQGLGGLSTVLDVKILDYPTHAASKPVAHDSQLRGHAPRAFHARRFGRGASSTPRIWRSWPDVHWSPSPTSKRVNLDTLTREEVAAWQPGDAPAAQRQDADRARCRAQAHRRHHCDRGEALPEGVDFRNRVIYYVGPVDPVRDEVVGPAGPTTSTRMDKFTAHDAREDRAAGDDRQGRARSGRDRGDSQARRGLPDGGWRRRVSWCRKPSAARAWSPSAISAWKPSTSSKSRTCRSRLPSTRGANRCTIRRPGDWQARIGKIPVTSE